MECPTCGIDAEAMEKIIEQAQKGIKIVERQLDETNEVFAAVEALVAAEQAQPLDLTAVREAVSRVVSAGIALRAKRAA